MNYEFWIISGLCVLLVLIIWLIYEVIDTKKTKEANQQIWIAVENLRQSFSEKTLEYIQRVDVDIRSKIDLIDFGKYINHFFEALINDKKESDKKVVKKRKDKKKVDKWDYFGK
jgi:hypothetical protein